MTTAVQILLALALAVAIILKTLDHGHHDDPGEFDDVRSLQRSINQRAALRRATRHRGPL